MADNTFSCSLKPQVAVPRRRSAVALRGFDLLRMLGTHGLGALEAAISDLHHETWLTVEFSADPAWGA